MTKPKRLPTPIFVCVLFAAITGIAVSQEKGPKKTASPCPGYNMPIIQPGEQMDFKMPMVEPSARVEFKGIVIDPCRDVKREMVRAVPTPTPMTPMQKDAASKPPIQLLPNGASPTIKTPSERLKQFALPGNGQKSEKH